MPSNVANALEGDGTDDKNVSGDTPTVSPAEKELTEGGYGW